MKEKIFENISEIKNDLRRNSPNILYKYRDWDCLNHRVILTKNEIWLAHPKTLNDDMDIRVPLRFNYEEINSPLFLPKLKKYAVQHNWYPQLNQESREFRVACENKLDQIKQNPIQYFKDSYRSVYKSDAYDCIGVLSLTKNPLSRTMWAHYANNSKGFCVGFGTIEIFEDIMPISFYRVDYVSEPMFWSFLNAENENLFEWFYIKHSDWSTEEEYRFITLDISNNKRVRKFRKSIIKEILVGANIEDSNLHGIIQELKIGYDSQVPLYKVVRDTNCYKIEKEKIDY